MIGRVIYPILVAAALSISASALFERFRPTSDFIDYYAVVSFPAYVQTPKLEFISIADFKVKLPFVQWDDYLRCAMRPSGHFVVVDHYTSSQYNREPSFADERLVDLAQADSSDITKWRLDIVTDARGDAKNWKYQVRDLKWPRENTPCFARHKITFETPWFGFTRSFELDSPAFWLIGTNPTPLKIPPNETDNATE